MLQIKTKKQTKHSFIKAAQFTKLPMYPNFIGLFSGQFPAVENFIKICHNVIFLNLQTEKQTT